MTRPVVGFCNSVWLKILKNSARNVSWSSASQKLVDFSSAKMEIDCDPDHGRSSGEACRRCWSAGRWVRLILRGIRRGNDRTARIKDENAGHGTRIAVLVENAPEAERSDGCELGIWQSHR